MGVCILGLAWLVALRKCDASFTNGITVCAVKRLTIVPKWVGQSLPRLGGAVQILRTMPTVDWVLLGSGEVNKGQGLWQASTAACLQTHVASLV